MRCFRSSFAITSILLLLGTVSAAGQPSIGPPPGPNIITVAKGGGDYRSIQAALDSITDASEEYPYLISVAPGVYEEQIALKPYVVIEGAGETLTTILSRQDYTVFAGSLGVELRSLTVECIAGDNEGCSAFWGDGYGAKLSNVTVRSVGRWSTGFASDCFPPGIILSDVRLELISTDGPVNSCGLVLDWGCYPGVVTPVVLENVSTRVKSLSCASPFYGHRITAIDSVVGSLAGYPVNLSRVEVFGDVTSGDWPGSDPPAIRHSVIHGSVGESFSSNPISISHSQVDGEVVLEHDDSKCFSVHDAELNPLDENCQPNPPPGEDPQADFSFSVTGRTVHFLNQSKGTQPLSYSWDFGDGATSTEENPTHVYGTVGDYIVILTVTNALGTDSIAKTVTVFQ